MRSVCSLAVCATLLIASSPAAEHNRLTPEEEANGWLLLFDGESLFGWRPVVEADWTVDDGIIAVTTGPVGLLRTTTQFGDYILKVDFRAAEGTNSGIFLRTSPDPTNVQRDCYELNIAPADNPFPTGSLVQRVKVTDAEATPDEWHTFEVTAQGNRLIVRLDGRRLLEYNDPSPVRKGFIGLQHNEGKVAFRNVKLRPLGQNPIFNAKDLTGWQSYPEMASEFSVTGAGWLHVKGGRGQLETKGEYGNFVLQLDCLTNDKELNSGIFFRCIPGEQMNGYESQIHNGYREGDRTQPVDCGTGGIFRRVDARRVVSNDGEWFRKTIIADGPHIAVWVNGYQVTDWTDKRKPDANPRRGLRTEPGTIMIQGHDPTTDISFRRIDISEIPERR